MKKTYGITVVLVLSILLLASCSNTEKEEIPNTDNPKKEVQYYPFTGLVPNDAPDARATAVMISNQKQARPQTGLSKADIVFEMLAEGNITRFMAIYQSMEPDVVGPVRSAREYFFTLAKGYDTVYIFSGAAEVVKEKLNKSGVDYIEESSVRADTRLFVRETFRKAPHNLYLQFGALQAVLEANEMDMTANNEELLFLKDGEKLPEANYQEGSAIKVDLFGGSPSIQFTYHKDTETYTRKQDGEELIELESEKPIQIENVLIVEATHKIADKKSGRRSIDVKTGGDATLLQKGQAQQIKWENRKGKIVPVHDGEVVPLVPGKTWILFVPDKQETGVNE